jgi:hypothetical protein
MPNATAANGDSRSGTILPKRVSVSRERLAATMRSHMLAALARALAGHAGGAPGRSYDLAALDPVTLQPTAHRRSSADMRSIAAFVGSHTSRRLRRERWHEQ